MRTVSGLAVVAVTGMGMAGLCQAREVSIQCTFIWKVGSEELCQAAGKGGNLAPCVMLLVEGCWAATEDVPHGTRSCSAQGAEGVTLDFPSTWLGNGRHSVPAWIRKNICLAERQNIICDHMGILLF